MIAAQPNFDAVAKELDIVSKGAAYVFFLLLPFSPHSQITFIGSTNPTNSLPRSKRYERLLKSHGFLPGAVGKSTAADDDEDGEEFEAKPTPKKRKAPATPKTPTPKKVKPATPRGKKAPVKKEEDDEDEADVKAESESSLSGTANPRQHAIRIQGC